MDKKEFLKQCGVWSWRCCETILETLGHIVVILWEFWIITVIAAFALLAWYFGWLSF